MPTFYQTAKTKRKWLRLYLVHLGRKTKVLNYLNISQLIISKQSLCKSIPLSAVWIFESLLSNQVEASKRVTLIAIMHWHRATILMYTDIFLLFLRLLSDFQERIELDNVSVASQNWTWMGNINLSKSRQESFLVFHAFTGYDYVSTFLQKRKSNLLENSS